MAGEKMILKSSSVSSGCETKLELSRAVRSDVAVSMNCVPFLFSPIITLLTPVT